MKKTLKEVAQIVDGKVVGEDSLIISGLSGIKEAKEGDLTFIANPKYSSLIKTTDASAIIVLEGTEKVDGKALVCVADPSVAFAKIAALFVGYDSKAEIGIHKNAVVSSEAKIGKNVSVGPCVVIENGVVLGDDSVIMAGCFIGRDSKVGKGCSLYPNVTIRERIVIGENVIVHSGTVVGADGFGFTNVEGVHEKIPQIGTVVIEDNVEIGANVTIDRARFDKTVIGKGTKIDNLVQIAHNVIIGENCIIVAQVGISGSSTIEKNSILAGQVGLAGHITIGAGSIVMAKSGVTKSIPPKSLVWGYPARPHNIAKRINACIQRLPEYAKFLNKIRKKIDD